MSMGSSLCGPKIRSKISGYSGKAMRKMSDLRGFWKSATDVDILLVTPGKAGQTTAAKLLKKFEELACGAHGMTLDSKHPSSFSGKTPPKRVSILNYPKSAVVDSGVLPFIKLEMALHGGSFPHESRTINSFVADQILYNAQDQAPAISNVHPFAVNCLDPLRTFAEKVNALASAILDGELVQKVRHYYDLFYLLESNHVVRRLGSDEHLKIKQSIRAVDVEFKQHKPDHNYDEPGTSKAFAPAAKLLAELGRAYDSSPIYYGEKPTFEDIMGKILVTRQRF